MTTYTTKDGSYEISGLECPRCKTLVGYHLTDDYLEFRCPRCSWVKYAELDGKPKPPPAPEDPGYNVFGKESEEMDISFLVIGVALVVALAIVINTMLAG